MNHTQETLRTRKSTRPTTKNCKENVRIKSHLKNNQKGFKQRKRWKYGSSTNGHSPPPLFKSLEGGNTGSQSS